MVPCPSSGRSLWRLSSSPSADVCRWSRTLTLCSVQTGWSTSPHPPSTARCAPRRPQTLWCSAPAASDSSPAACPGWWSGWLFDHVLPSSFCLLYASRCRINVCSGSRDHFSFFFFTSSIPCRCSLESSRRLVTCRRSLTHAAPRLSNQRSGSFVSGNVWWCGYALTSIRGNISDKKQTHLPGKHKHR